MITESQILSMLKSGDLPIGDILEIELMQTDVELENRRYDAVIQVRWR